MKGVAFFSSECVGGVVTRFEEFVDCREESLGVGGTKVYDMGVVSGPGCVKSMLILLKMVYVYFEMNC